MEHAMLPSLRIGNTFTSKTEFRAQRNRAYGGGIDLVFTNGVFCTSPANRGWANYGSGFWRCKSEPQEIPSIAFRCCHDCIQIDVLVNMGSSQEA